MPWLTPAGSRCPGNSPGCAEHFLSDCRSAQPAAISSRRFARGARRTSAHSAGAHRGGLPHQDCSGQAKSTPKTSTHNFAIKACQESQRSLQRPTPPLPPVRMRRTSCVAGLPECLCLQQPPRRHALLRHCHLDLGFKVSRDSQTI